MNSESLIGCSVGFTPLKRLSVCVQLKARKSSFCDGGPNRRWSVSASLSLSQQLLQASVSEHRHSRPAPPHPAALMFLAMNRDVKHLQAASCEGFMRCASIIFLLITHRSDPGLIIAWNSETDQIWQLCMYFLYVCHKHLPWWLACVQRTSKNEFEFIFQLLSTRRYNENNKNNRIIITECVEVIETLKEPLKTL